MARACPPCPRPVAMLRSRRDSQHAGQRRGGREASVQTGRTSHSRGPGSGYERGRYLKMSANELAPRPAGSISSSPKSNWALQRSPMAGVQRALLPARLPAHHRTEAPRQRITRVADASKREMDLTSGERTATAVLRPCDSGGSAFALWSGAWQAVLLMRQALTVTAPCVARCCFALRQEAVVMQQS